MHKYNFKNKSEFTSAQNIGQDLGAFFENHTCF